MGLFGRNRRPSTSRVAEGGPDLSSSAGSAATGAGAKFQQAQPDESKPQKNAKKTTEDPLDLFGADSDDSDDDATIDRYANGDGDEALDEQEALAAESKKVSTLLSKVSPIMVNCGWSAD